MSFKVLNGTDNSVISNGPGKNANFSKLKKKINNVVTPRYMMQTDSHKIKTELKLGKQICSSPN